jgi:DNA polymerase delta subunit 1
MNWLEVPAGKYKLLKGKDRKSQCQIELSVRYDVHLYVCSLF